MPRRSSVVSKGSPGPIIWIALSCTFLSATSATADLRFLGVTWTGDVSLIDPATGASTAVGSLGYSNLNAMSGSPSGGFYVSGRTGLLLSVSPVTGQATEIATILVPGYVTDIRGLAVSANGTLYAVQDGGFDQDQNPPYGLDLPDLLVQINVVTGTGTIVGTLGSSNIQSLSFGADGELYGWGVKSHEQDDTSGLVSIDPADASTTFIGEPDPASAPRPQSLATGPGGIMYGASADGLYTVDLSDGTTALVGGNGTLGDVRGIALVSTPVPALQPIALILTACLLGGSARRRLRTRSRAAEFG